MISIEPFKETPLVSIKPRREFYMDHNFGITDRYYHGLIEKYVSGSETDLDSQMNIRTFGDGCIGVEDTRGYREYYMTVRYFRGNYGELNGAMNYLFAVTQLYVKLCFSVGVTEACRIIMEHNLPPITLIALILHREWRWLLVFKIEDKEKFSRLSEAIMLYC